MNNNINIKLVIYRRYFPRFLQYMVTYSYIYYRKFREYIGSHANFKKNKKHTGKPEVVYLTGFPRSGTTVLKYYFSEYPGFEMADFDPAGFFVSWRSSKKKSRIIFDKSNHYIYTAENIFRAYGSKVALCCIVRDPRDTLLSILDFEHSLEVPRNKRFWKKWYKQYKNFILFADNCEFASNIYFLRYEDLVRYPSQAKIDFLNWLNIKVKDGLISEEYTVSSPEREVHDKVILHKSVKPIGLEKWKKNSVDIKTRQLINSWKSDNELISLMDLFGYTNEGIKVAKFIPKNFHMFDPRKKQYGS